MKTDFFSCPAGNVKLDKLRMLVPYFLQARKDLPGRREGEKKCFLDFHLPSYILTGKKNGDELIVVDFFLIIEIKICWEGGKTERNILK